MNTKLIIAVACVLLSGCTAMPMAMNTALLPGLIPQNPPARTPIYPDSSSLFPQQSSNPLVIVQPPTLSPNPQPTQAQTPSTPSAPITGTLSQQTFAAIADRLYKNEMGGDPSKLLRWNSQENFADLGLGHLVWYPANQRGRYTETFPQYLKYVEAQRVPLPTWLAQRPVNGGPWANQAAFERAKNDKQMLELRNFLEKTLPLQTAFMAGQLRAKLPALTRTLPPAEQQRVFSNFQVMEKTQGGLYPLLDYTLFQGEGANPAERYKNQGWGLIQVLQAMETVSPGPAALGEFMRAADDTLVQRIANAPAERREARLLASWQNRLRTYKVPTRILASR